MAKKLSVDELLRLACIYAEQDRISFLVAWEGCDGPEDLALRREEVAFLAQLQAYRKKRWGRTKLEKACAEAKEVPAHQVKKYLEEQP